MRNVPAELVYVLLFVAIVAVQVYRAWRSRRQQLPAPVPDATRTGDPPLSPSEQTLAALEALPGLVPTVEWGRAPSPRPPAPRPAPGIATHPGRVARSLVAGRGSLRAAVIAMTVLGPCRAVAPIGNDPIGGAADRPLR